jgi:hypothetical protein
MLVFVFCSWSFAKAARHYSTQGKTERVDLNLRIKRNSCDEKATGFGALSCCSLVPHAFCSCPVPSRHRDGTYRAGVMLLSGFPGFSGFSSSPKEK